MVVQLADWLALWSAERMVSLKAAKLVDGTELGKAVRSDVMWVVLKVYQWVVRKVVQ